MKELRYVCRRKEKGKKGVVRKRKCVSQGGRKKETDWKHRERNDKRKNNRGTFRNREKK